MATSITSIASAVAPLATAPAVARRRTQLMMIEAINVTSIVTVGGGDKECRRHIR